MTQFEAEVRNSIGQLQATIAKLTAETQRANTAMAGLSGTTRQVATDVERVGTNGSRSIKEIEKGAKSAGLGFGGMASAVATMNPLFLASGIAIGAMVSGVHELISSFGEASRKAEELEDRIRKARKAAYKDAVDTVLHADVQGRRAAASAPFRTSYDEPIPPEIIAATRRGVEHGMSEQDARDAAIAAKRKADYLASGEGIFARAPKATQEDIDRAAAGYGGDQSGYEQAEQARKYGPAFQQAQLIEVMQENNALQRQILEHGKINDITGIRVGETGQEQAERQARDLQNIRAQVVEDSK